MKFTIQKSGILDVLAKIQGIAGRKSNLAITSCLLITAEADGVILQATDLETGFEGRYSAVVENTGAVAINARKFFEIVRDFPSDEIHISEVDNHWIEISNNQVEYHIVGMNPDDFPDIPVLESVPFFSLESQELKRMIEQALVIGPTDDKRAHIIGVYFEHITEEEPQVARMVSTDGSRLSKVDSPLESSVDVALESGAIIPKKGLQEVNKFLDGDGSVEIGFKENHLITKKDAEIIIIRLLEGEFPKYQDLLKAAGGTVVNMEKKPFQMMLKRMSILGSENYKGVIFRFSQGTLVTSSTNPDIGESKEEMQIEYDGDTIEVAFNPRFFMDAINVIGESDVSLQIIDDEKPCMIHGQGNNLFVSVIMPMRI